MTTKILPAYDGDCLLLTFLNGDQKKNILIDGGTGRTYKQLIQELRSIQALGECIDLLIVSHIDDDHIGGVLKIFEDPNFNTKLIKQVWFNSGAIIAEQLESAYNTKREVALNSQDSLNISVNQGNTLERYLSKLSIWDRQIIHTDLKSIDFEGLKISILSPNYESLKKLHENWPVQRDVSTPIGSDKNDYSSSIKELGLITTYKEDKAVFNGSSIAVLIENENKKLLFLGDSHPSVVAESLQSLGYSFDNPLEADFIKLAHHGSRHNISAELLQLWKCKNYAISTNALKHGLPNKECLSKVIISSGNGVNLYFNYPIFKERNIFNKTEMEEYDFKCVDLSSNSYNYAIAI